jgi:hypothetical protein
LPLADFTVQNASGESRISFRAVHASIVKLVDDLQTAINQRQAEAKRLAGLAANALASAKSSLSEAQALQAVQQFLGGLSLTNLPSGVTEQEVTALLGDAQAQKDSSADFISQAKAQATQADAILPLLDEALQLQQTAVNFFSTTPFFSDTDGDQAALAQMVAQEEDISKRAAAAGATVAGVGPVGNKPEASTLDKLITAGKVLLAIAVVGTVFYIAYHVHAAVKS